jgi:hypothetical protein
MIKAGPSGQKLEIRLKALPKQGAMSRSSVDQWGSTLPLVVIRSQDLDHV